MQYGNFVGIGLLVERLHSFLDIGIGHLTIGEVVLIEVILRLLLDQFRKLCLILCQQLLGRSNNIALLCKILVDDDWHRQQVANDIFGRSSLFLFLLGSWLWRVQLHRPASGRNHIAIILHRFTPVVHQTVIDIIRLDKRLIYLEDSQQRVTQPLDKFLGCKTRDESVKLSPVRIAPPGKTLLEHLFLITEIYIPGNSITHCLRVTLQ